MAGFLKALGLESKPEYIEKIPETLCEDDFHLHDVSIYQRMATCVESQLAKVRSHMEDPTLLGALPETMCSLIYSDNLTPWPWMCTLAMDVYIQWSVLPIACNRHSLL